MNKTIFWLLQNTSFTSFENDYNNIDNIRKGTDRETYK